MHNRYFQKQKLRNSKLGFLLHGDSPRWNLVCFAAGACRLRHHWPGVLLSDEIWSSVSTLSFQKVAFFLSPSCRVPLAYFFSKLIEILDKVRTRPEKNVPSGAELKRASRELELFVSALTPLVSFELKRALFKKA